MKVIIQKFAILLFLVCYLPFSGLAWGTLGHRIVGQIAESHLTKKAKWQVSKILGTESIAMVSNWADFVKSDPTYNYMYNWHFINFKEGLTEDAVEAYLATDTAVDAYTKINFLTAALKDKTTSPENKVLYLKVLIHLVGDIHQPMHTGRPDDLGGNRVKVRWFNETKNLHQIWDDQLIIFQQLSYTEYATAINHVTKEEKKMLQQQPVSKWVYQSYQLAERIYKETQADERLDYKYNFNFIDALNQQLLRGGVHLAGLLNEIFG